MPEPILALEGVTLRSPEGLPVFQDLTWQLPRGARAHLDEGQGGATAFLRLCCGIAEPEAGRVLLDGVALGPDGSAHPFLERAALGFVPSDGGLAVNLSLLDNLALPLRFARGLERGAAEDQAQRWLERAGLGSLARQRPHVPGDGQSWLASLARAAAKGPELLLLDRPSGGLDARGLRAARDILQDLAQAPDISLVLVGGAWLSEFGQPLTLTEGPAHTGRTP